MVLISCISTEGIHVNYKGQFQENQWDEFFFIGYLEYVKNIIKVQKITKKERKKKTRERVCSTAMKNGHGHSNTIWYDTCMEKFRK